MFRRHKLVWLQAGSLVATAAILPWMAAGPRFARTLLTLCESALLISLAAFAWCFVLAFCLYAAIGRVERADVMGVTLRTSAAAVWFAPATILLASLSPLFLPAALLLVVSATRVLYAEWRVTDAPEPEPRPLVVPLEFGWYGAGELTAPVLPRHFTPALMISAALQAGAAALALRHHFLAAACFALAASVATVFAISAGVWRMAPQPSLPRNIFGVVLTVVLSAFLIVMGVAGGSGSGFGLGTGGNSNAQLLAKKHPAAAPAAPALPNAMRMKKLRPLPPDALPVAGSFPGVILWPEVEPVTQLVAPMPSSPGAFVARGRTFSIPFSGEYWMFRQFYLRPPPGSYFRRGNPAEFSFSTTDRWPLEMEAHQKLERELDLSCCSAIQIDIRNADRYPGTIALELVAAGAAPLSFGKVPILSRPDLAATPVKPVNETLTFPVPPVASFVCREFKVVFHRLRFREDKSARVALDRFVLVPHGGVVER